jgi:hypothetical protein
MFDLPEGPKTPIVSNFPAGTISSLSLLSGEMLEKGTLVQETSPTGGHVDLYRLENVRGFPKNLIARVSSGGAILFFMDHSYHYKQRPLCQRRGNQSRQRVLHHGQRGGLLSHQDPNRVLGQPHSS